MRRPVRTRVDARRVARRITSDATALWDAGRLINGRTPLRSDEIVPVVLLRRAAQRVEDLLDRDGADPSKNGK